MDKILCSKEIVRGRHPQNLIDPKANPLKTLIQFEGHEANVTRRLHGGVVRERWVELIRNGVHRELGELPRQLEHVKLLALFKADQHLQRVAMGC